jgi:hypothetical protein
MHALQILYSSTTTRVVLTHYHLMHYIVFYYIMCFWRKHMPLFYLTVQNIVVLYCIWARSTHCRTS